VPPQRAPIWRDRTFLPLWTGLLVSNAGDWITYVAMYAAVYQQTHSALALVGLRLIHLVPELVFAPFAGVFVDRWRRKATLVVSPQVAALIVAPLVVVHPVALIFAAELALTVVTMFFDPAVSAAIPDIVAAEDLPQANTLAQVSATVATLVGGLSGGLLVSAIGPSVAFGVDGVSFLVIAALAATVQVRENMVPTSVGSIHREFAEGVGVLRHRPVVAAVVVAGALFTFAPASIFTVGIMFSQSVLHAGTAGYGVLLAGLGMGSCVGALGMFLVHRRPPEDLTFALTGLALGAAIAAMGLSHSLVPAAVFYAAAGCMALINGVASATLVQRLVPDRLRGRVFGVSSGLNHLAAAVSAVLIAAVIGILGASGVIATSGALAAATGLVILVIVLRRAPS
jgi:MFS family permease